MLPAATRPRVPSTLYVAFELGNTEWKLAMTTALEQPARVCTVPARDRKVLGVELARAKKHFELTTAALCGVVMKPDVTDSGYIDTSRVAACRIASWIHPVSK